MITVLRYGFMVVSDLNALLRQVESEGRQVVSVSVLPSTRAGEHYEAFIVSRTGAAV